jgi:GH25 family lysozyme M1 (1,4-beta-N-acetylmuramidase)
MSNGQHAQGIDVSRWQQTIDWGKVKAAGILYAVCKASQATNYKDPTFDVNWKGMKDAGIARSAYHFFKPALDGKKQAAWFAGVVKEPGDLPLVLDIETDDGLDKASLLRSTEAFLAELERLTGRKPIIYTGPGFWNSRLAWPAPPAWTNDYILWVAHYTQNPQPMVPKGWTTWTIWQYTDRGKVDGIGGNVDRNHFNGTGDDFKKWLQGLGAGAPATPSPGTGTAPVTPATTAATAQAVIEKYFVALNSRNLDALLALYHPNAAHVTAMHTAQGAPAIRSWYHDLLNNKLPAAAFNVGAIEPAGTSWKFKWTGGNASAVVKDGEDTIAVVEGKISYHACVFTITSTVANRI